jgi:hypothetical protein
VSIQDQWADGRQPNAARLINLWRRTHCAAVGRWLPKLPFTDLFVVDQCVVLVAKLRWIKLQQLPARLHREFPENRQPDAGILIDEDELTVLP